MVHKTRKHTSRKNKKDVAGIYSIPELRRSFEHIEEFVNRKIASKEGKDRIVNELCKEWRQVFMKTLDKKSAEAFVDNMIEKSHTNRRRTIKHRGGVAPVLGGETRQGLYLAQGTIPNADGHIPLSSGAKSNFGFYTPYVDKGFWNPEPGQSYDPVPGQTRFPTSVPVGMGSNAVHFSTKGGAKTEKRGIKRRDRTLRRRGGAGAILSQAFTHPISSSSPPGVLQDMQDMWYGKEVGPSPDQVQRSPSYQLGSLYPKIVSL
jgi:hypothetical protein